MELLTDSQKELYSTMLPLYGATLRQKETAKLLNVSVGTLSRQREQGIGISYKKLDSKSKNGTIVYPLQEVVKYLTETEEKEGE
jgi:hypothetical protein